jgi:hypothetical protein
MFWKGILSLRSLLEDILDVLEGDFVLKEPSYRHFAWTGR